MPADQVSVSQKEFRPCRATSTAPAAPFWRWPPPVARLPSSAPAPRARALANRLRDRLDGAEITLIDPRASSISTSPASRWSPPGLKPAGYVVSADHRLAAPRCDLDRGARAAGRPRGQTVTTEGGTRSPTTTSCWPPASCSTMTRSRASRSTWWARTASARSMPGPNTPQDLGGDGSLRRGRRAGHLHPPATEMKCAGAPLKHTFLIDDRLRGGQPRNAEIVYAAPQGRSSACRSWPRRCGCSSTSAGSRRTMHDAR
jgi:sulfide:quinone oxidoreductase